MIVIVGSFSNQTECNCVDANSTTGAHICTAHKTEKIKKQKTNDEPTKLLCVRLVFYFS